MGNDTVVKNNPSCPGTLDAAGENFEASCDLVGRYVGVALSEQTFLTICNIDIFELSGGHGGGGHDGSLALDGAFTW